MAEYTPNLDLLKKDPTIDGSDTFNIKTMLNDNWDKIDTEIGNLKNIAHGAVIDLTALKAIDTTNMPDNITIIVKSLGFYRFNSTSTLAPDDKGIVQPTAGPGRWINDTAALNTKVDEHKAENMSQHGDLVTLKTTEKTNLVGAINELFQFGLDGKNLLETSIKSKGGTVSKVGEVATFNELDVGVQSIETDKTGDATAVAGDILATKTAYAKGVKLIGSMANRGAVANTITTQGGQFIIPAGYHNGSGKVTASFANLIAENVKNGVNIGGVVGTLAAGKRHAIGTYPFNEGTYKITVTGLAFKPSTVILTAKYTPNGTTYFMAVTSLLSYNSDLKRAYMRLNSSTSDLCFVNNELVFTNDGFELSSFTESLYPKEWTYLAIE